MSAELIRTKRTTTTWPALAEQSLKTMPPQPEVVETREDVEFWKRAVVISKCQGQVLENWTQWFQNCFVLAPAKLWQEILPGWVFGTQVNVYKSSNPPLEDKIVKNIAGYGSQLGTIEDFLQVVQKKLKLQPETLDEKDKAAVARLNELVAEVNVAKKLMAK